MDKPPYENPGERSPEEKLKKQFEPLHYTQSHRQSDWFSRVFFGLFVILVGVMFLARSLGMVNGIDWRQFFSHIWPVFIIFVGLSILSRGGIFAKIISSLIMVFILAFFFLWFFNIPVHFKYQGREVNVPIKQFDTWIKQ